MCITLELLLEVESSTVSRKKLEVSKYHVQEQSKTCHIEKLTYTTRDVRAKYA